MKHASRLSPKLVGGVFVALVSVFLWRWYVPAAPTPDPPRDPPVPTVVLPPPTPPPDLDLELELPDPPTLDDLLVLAGPNGVVCAAELPGGAAVGSARLDAELPEGFLGVATVGAGHVVLSEVPDEGSGTLRVEGFAPAELAWGPAGCLPEPLLLEPARAAVTGRVDQADSEVTVEVCGRPAVLDEGGAYYADAEPGVPCTVRFRRHYGSFQWEVSETVTPQVGTDPIVDVEAPGPLAVLPLEWDGRLRITSDWTDQGLLGRRVIAIADQPAPVDPVEAHLLAAGPPEADGEYVTLHLENGDTVSIGLRVIGFEDWLLAH